MSESSNTVHKSESQGVPHALSRAAATYTHPDDVLNDPGLTVAAKKAVLASWSSDSRSVEDAPALRRLDSGAIVEVDAILRALASLDEPATAPKQPSRLPQFPSARRNVISRWLNRAGRPDSSNDDDDPPPAPAGLAVPFRPTFVAAHGGGVESWRGSARATG